jgi:hypothetical protein
MKCIICNTEMIIRGRYIECPIYAVIIQDNHYYINTRSTNSQLVINEKFIIYNNRLEKFSSINDQNKQFLMSTKLMTDEECIKMGSRLDNLVAFI